MPAYNPGSFGNDPEIFDERSQGLGHRPRLRTTGSRKVRSLGIEDFRDLAQAGSTQVGFEACEKTARLVPHCVTLAKCFHPGCQKRAQQEGLDRTLVIRAVAFHHAAFVSSAIERIVRR